MDNLFFVFIEGTSAAVTFTLVWFMIKPYRMMGQRRFLGLPIGFAFLGVSYIFMGASLLTSEFSLLQEIKWLQLFSGAYAFVFIAMTYYLPSDIRDEKARLFFQSVVSFTVLAAILLVVIAFLPPVFALPSYKVADEYFRLFNMILALYVTVHTVRSHISKLDPKTILAPLGYALLGFSEYSFMIWSLDSSFSAFVGAHIIRLAGLLAFLFDSYSAVMTPLKHISRGRLPRA